MAQILSTDIKHDVTGVAIDTKNQAHVNDVRQRIAMLKQSNTSLFYNEPSVKPNDDEIFKEIQIKASNFVRAKGIIEEDELAKTLEKNNLYLYSYPHKETSRDKKDVARMAFNGWIDRPNEKDMSSTLRDLKNLKKPRADMKPDDYDLSHSSVWNVFSQVPEFKEIENKLKKGLSMYGVSQADLPSLNLKDFCFIMNEQFRGNRDSAKVFQQSYKAKHTIKFINENEEEFRTGMLSMPGVKKEYVDTLVGAMKKGLTDLSSEIDSSGKPKWEGQPVIDVHHIVNIKDASTKEHENKSFADINNYENMCFIVRNPQHDAMHALENDMNGNYREDIFYNREIDKEFIYRIQPPEGVKCMFGFNNMIYDKEYLATHDMSKEAVKARSSENQQVRKVLNKKWTDNDSQAKKDLIRKNEKNLRDY